MLNPLKNAKNRKPKIKPPLRPIRWDIPPDIFEKTGRPIAPNIMYIKTDIVPSILPKKKPAKAIANVCNVNGTPKGVGIERTDVIAKIAVNTLIFIILFAFINPPYTIKI